MPTRCLRATLKSTATTRLCPQHQRQRQRQRRRRRQCRRTCFSLSRNLLYFFNLTQLSQLISEYLIVWQISHSAQDVRNVLTREANKSPELILILSLPLVSVSQYRTGIMWLFLFTRHTTLVSFVNTLRLYKMAILYYLMITYTF